VASSRPKAKGSKRRSVAEVVVCINDVLPGVAEGMTKQGLLDAIGQTSGPTLLRALHALRDQWGAGVEVKRNRWFMRDRVALPLLAPEDNDVVAVLIAAAIVHPVADEDLRGRLQALAEQLDDRRHELRAGARFPAKAITASLTLGSRLHEHTMRTLLQTVRKGVVRMHYTSPWTNVTVEHTVEPWELRIHDGTLYLRGWCRDSAGPRTFRLTHIREDVQALVEDARAPLPAPDQTWAAGNPAFGIDEDRPDTAVIRIRGGVARWVYPVVWSPAQRDVWIEPDELLERTVPYQSCREMARRVLSIIDAVESIGPVELKDEVDQAVAHWRGRRTRGPTAKSARKR